MKKYSLFDTHCDTISRYDEKDYSLRKNNLHIDLTRGKEYPHYAQMFAIFADSKTTPAPFDECRRQRDIFLRETAANSDLVCVCRNSSDIQAAEESGKIAAMQSIEGGELLDCDEGKLDLAAQWGVRCINLTWNRANALSGTNVEDTLRGLGDRGKAFVKRAQKYNILVDVSHLSDRGFFDLLDITEKPIIASHSNARALCDHSRNLTDEMFKELTAAGGCVGINMFSLFIGRNNTIDDVIAHIEHFLELGGEKSVGFGCDFDGCEQLPNGICGIEDMYKIAEAMEQRNYSEQLIEDIF